MDTTHDRRLLRLPGLLLGIGLGGFVDGILLHQVLQWHHMLSNSGDDSIGLERFAPDTVAGLRVNVVWDGLFHSVTWLAVVVGLAFLYRRVSRAQGRLWTSRVLWGWVLAGWGVFNLVEGVLNHHLLAVHHVREGHDNELLYDLGYLALGLLLVLGGWLLQRGASPVVSPSARR